MDSFDILHQAMLAALEVRWTSMNKKIFLGLCLLISTQAFAIKGQPCYQAYAETQKEVIRGKLYRKMFQVVELLHKISDSEDEKVQTQAREDLEKLEQFDAIFAHAQFLEHEMLTEVLIEEYREGNLLCGNEAEAKLSMFHNFLKEVVKILPRISTDLRNNP